MQRVDIGHGRGWLSPAPAASLARIDRALGHPLQITEAGRTGERQQELRDLYLAGKGNYAAPRGESPHERGDAFDSDEAQRHLALLEEHGWYRPLPSERWHFLYRASQDRHRNDPTPASTQPAATPPTEIGEDMFIADCPNGSFLVVPQGNGKPRAVVLDGDSGAERAGIPRLKFRSTGSIEMLTAAVQF
ncbi:hypothetical protein [Microbacterium sp. XT11]|uniref:hypothetical protein n=1 Tax=Microbacterium sp. XT11 TaxID=367477 RepID=UPI000829A53A|nr:hypothetical protein [Microbacterium sp. XT11]